MTQRSMTSTRRLASRLMVLLALASMAAGCQFGEPDDAVPYVRLEAGRELDYAWSLAEYDAAGVETNRQIDTVEVRIAGMFDWIGPYVPVSRVVVGSRAAPHQWSLIWYAFHREDLVEVAYQDPTGELSDPGVLASRSLHAPHALRAIGRDSLASAPTLLEQRRSTYRYPLRPGDEWTEYTVPHRAVRRVESVETISVPFGTFRCALVTTTLYYEDYRTVRPVAWRDWVSTEGLVRREIVTTDPGGTSPLSVERLDLVDLRRP
jgi:hypothetical protein